MHTYARIIWALALSCQQTLFTAGTDDYRCKILTVSLDSTIYHADIASISRLSHVHVFLKMRVHVDTYPQRQLNTLGH